MSVALRLLDAEARLANLSARRRQDLGGRYRSDPVGYARDVLGIHLWHRQAEAFRALTQPPYKVLVRAGHAVGKTVLAAAAVLWLHDCWSPGIVLSTAPTDFSVKNVLWKEVRRLRAGRGGWAGPKIPRLETGPLHFAAGFTARDDAAFQGHHNPGMVGVVFEEAVGIAPVFWDAAKTMLTGEAYAFLGIFNPTDTSSQAWAEEQTGHYRVVQMSCLDHPNILAELAGLPPPHPSAIRLGPLTEMLEAWSVPLGPHESPQETDVEWPPRSGRWLRPGPVAEARLLGRWPTAGLHSVWTEALWERCLAAAAEPKPGWKVVVGVDVARFGDDFTSLAVRKGTCLMHLEQQQGWPITRTAERVKSLCHKFTGSPEQARRVPVHVDEAGLGGGLVDIHGGYNFLGVNSSSTSRLPERYRNVRSELWFGAAEIARAGLMDLSRLAGPVRAELKRQLLAPTYGIDPAGRVVVEPKDETKLRIKRSPDLADAVNLAYLTVSRPGESVAGRV